MTKFLRIALLAVPAAALAARGRRPRVVCALFWPFDLTRYFAPWRPILVAPIGLNFLSLYGATVSASTRRP